MTGMTSQAAGLKTSIDSSLSQLAAAVDQEAASDELRRFLDLQARFHRYSWGNCLLIAMAKPDATFVAGFSQWKRLGRRVKRGEHAIRIMAPCPIRFENPKTGEEENRLFFKTACVFDVSQTEGTSLPDFQVPDVEANGDMLLRALAGVASRRGIEVEYGALDNGHYGVSMGGRVKIATGYPTGQQAKTLAHELAHESLHRSADGVVDRAITREARELEAESVAYVVCRHFGLDVQLRASRYIALWGGDAKKLAASFGRISGAARVLIEDINARMDSSRT